MAFVTTITATTGKGASKREASREVTWPASPDELRDGIGPWRNMRELFEDAMRARTVKIQAELRSELDGASTPTEKPELGW